MLCYAMLCYAMLCYAKQNYYMAYMAWHETCRHLLCSGRKSLELVKKKEQK